jgi:hypothetical protein
MKEFDLCEVVFEFMGSKLFDMVNGTMVYSLWKINNIHHRPYVADNGGRL